MRFTLVTTGFAWVLTLTVGAFTSVGFAEGHLPVEPSIEEQQINESEIVEEFVDLASQETIIILKSGVIILYSPYYPLLKPKDYYRPESIEGVIRPDAL